MNPEEGFRLFNEPDQWNLELHERPGVFAARRPLPAFVRSALTVGVVALVAVIAFALFTAGVRSLSGPVVPPASPNPTPLAGALPDDGFVMPPTYRELATDWDGTESIVSLDGNASYPWAVNVLDRSSSELFISWVGGGGGGACGGHLGVDVWETDTTVTVAAVSSRASGTGACTLMLNIGAGGVPLQKPLGNRRVLHAPVSADAQPYADSLEPTIPSFTSSNYGDLWLGERVPENSRVVRWDADACGDGWWVSSDAAVVLRVRTEGARRDGAIRSISIGSPGVTMTEPTTDAAMSGLEVGMSGDEVMERLYPGRAVPSDSVTTIAGTYGGSLTPEFGHRAENEQWPGPSRDNVLVWLHIVPAGTDGQAENNSGSDECP